ncbi:hypothetical protein F66182_4673 [Fusarium sp. NRRL 66182]|nr:hypothetical protein F66182_4673 [Fusarium sp. NRRL 66182]
MPKQDDDAAAAGHEEGAAHPNQDVHQTRRWWSVTDMAFVGPDLLLIMNNLEVMSGQISKLTEMVANAKIGPRSSNASSRRSSNASSRRSSYAKSAADVEGEENDTSTAVDSLTGNEDFYSIFEAFITDKKYTTNVKRTKNTPARADEFREVAVAQIKDLWDPETLDDMVTTLRSLDADQLVDLYIGLGKQYRAKKHVGKEKEVQTVTDSFRTDIQETAPVPGANRENTQSTEPNTPRRPEKRKAPKTPAPRRHIRGRNVVEDSDDEAEASG